MKIRNYNLVLSYRDLALFAYYNHDYYPKNIMIISVSVLSISSSLKLLFTNVYSLVELITWFKTESIWMELESLRIGFNDIWYVVYKG